MNALTPIDFVKPKGGPATPNPLLVSSLVSLDDIPSLPRAALLDLWRELHGCPPPKNLSLPILTMALTYELQLKQHGGAKKRVLKDLDALAVGQQVKVNPKARLQPGTQLLREWKGRTWTVEVVEGGFMMNGARHESLSAIAKLITGAHWSGPRFFGLHKAGNGTADV